MGKRAEQVASRLVVRRIPDFHAEAHRAAGQDTLFDVWRFDVFFTTTDHQVLDTVAADKIHRGPAVIEQVHAGLKNSALTHLPPVVWSRSHGVLDMRDEAISLSEVCRGCDYLPLPITETEGTRKI